MADATVEVKVFRYDPSSDEEPYYRTYRVPFEEGMSVFDALDFIYQNLDGTIAYYDHAGCSLGICGRCTAIINGKHGLLCQTPVRGDTKIDPVSEDAVLRDLVTVSDAPPCHQ